MVWCGLGKRYYGYLGYGGNFSIGFGFYGSFFKMLVKL